MPVNSCQKGKRIEREAAALLRSLGFDARRGQQYAGRAASGGESPDVIVADLPGVHIEVKGVKGLDIGTAALTAALEQSRRDAHESCAPVVLWKPLRRPWRLTWTTPELPGVQTTTVGPDAIRAVLMRLNQPAKPP